MRCLTAFDARSEVERLVLAGYRVPEGSSVERVSQAWASAMDDVEVVDVQAGASGYLRDGGPHWPKPSEIRKRALEARAARTSGGADSATLDRRYRAWENHSCDQNARDRECSQCVAGCPVCGAVRQVCHELSGMLGIRHNAVEHNRQRVRWVGLPYSSEATAMYEAARKEAPARAPALPMRRPDADRHIDREAWTRRQREQLDALRRIEGRAPDSQAAD